MGQIQLTISSRVLPKFVCRAVRLQPDENSHPLDILESGMNFMESADVEVAHKAIEVARVPCEQRTKPVTEIVARFVGNEREVGGHRRSVITQRIAERKVAKFLGFGNPFIRAVE